MGVVRTTVDEKIISGNTGNQVTEPEAQEPVKEVSNEADKLDEVKVQDEAPYALPDEQVKEEAPKLEAQDEYGNETSESQPQGRVYTEEEVNRMMRERFKRTEEGKRQEAEAQPANEENWEAELEGFVEKTIHKLTEKQQAKIREQKEAESLGRLESNIHSTMAKYKDFKDVVGKVPMTDFMVKATKNFKDPGAFIYAASKTQAKELDRIARLDDPLDQAAEIGKLEERMRRIKGATGSPRPITKVESDVANRENVRQSVDELIRRDQIKKFQRRY